MWGWEFDNEVADRDWLHDAWPILTERVRRLRQPELDALDDRFRAATVPIRPLGMSRSTMAEREEWWQLRYPLRVQLRYPLRVTGDPEAPLPPTWTPPPTCIG